jgi:serine phosphatase RsbU (regulator of sigma subunit)
MADQVHPRLIVVSERDHRFIDLDDKECGVGRAPENAIVVKDDMVSRRHCVIEQAGSGWRVRDLKSFNGTYLNGERVADEKLNPWDSVRVGRTRIFYVEPAGSSPPPPPVAVPAQQAPQPESPPGAPEVGEATMGMTRAMQLPSARFAQLMAEPGSRLAIEDAIRRERTEVERQIGRRLRDESAPTTTPIAGGLAARARRIGPLDGGGDFYDVLTDDREPDALWAAVGSVSGQGVVASIAAAGARHALRGVVFAGTGEVLDRIARLRDLLAQTLHPGTAISIVLARGTLGGKIRVAATGGTGVHVYRARGEVEVLRATGKRDEAAARLATLDVTLASDDRLLLASDGAASLRAPGGGEPFSDARLADTFRAAGGLPPSESLGRIMDALVAHGAGAADRDATAALLTRA